MARPVRVGFTLANCEGSDGGANPTVASLLSMARMAEDLGFDSVWAPDHMQHAEQDLMEHFGLEGREQWSDSPLIGWWEAWTLLTAVACHTSRVQIGPAVACTQFRNPALLAKMAETLDEISGGRLILGLGAGDASGEVRIFGMPEDHPVSRFEEAVTIIAGMLRDGRSDFQGRFSRTEGCELRLRGPRPAGPPLMISAKGPRMQGIAARYADSWNGFLGYHGNQAAAIVPWMEGMDRACEAIGRDPASLPRVASLLGALPGIDIPGSRPLTGTPAQIAEQLAAFADVGVCEVLLWLEPSTPVALEHFGQALALLD